MKQMSHRELLGYNEFIGVSKGKTVVGEFSLGHWIVDKCGDQVQPHGHENAHVVIVTGGRFLSAAKGEARSVLPQMVYNPPETFHQDHFAVGPGSFFTISIPAFVVREIALPEEPTQVSQMIPCAIVTKLMHECVRPRTLGSLDIESLCFEIVSSISNPLIERCAPVWLKSACDMLRDSYAEEVLVSDVSRAVGVHPIHLTRTFRTFYHCTPGEFLRLWRVQKAAELLTLTNLSLVEVAFQTGFADQSHFSKHFRRVYGLPPGEYRRLVGSTAVLC